MKHLMPPAEFYSDQSMTDLQSYLPALPNCDNVSLRQPEAGRNMGRYICVPLLIPASKDTGSLKSEITMCAA